MALYVNSTDLATCGMHGRLQYMAQRLLAIAEEKERQRKAEEEEILAGGGGAHDVDDAASDWSRSQVLHPHCWCTCRRRGAHAYALGSLCSSPSLSLHRLACTRTYHALEGVHGGAD